MPDQEVVSHVCAQNMSDNKTDSH